MYDAGMSTRPQARVANPIPAGETFQRAYMDALVSDFSLYDSGPPGGYEGRALKLSPAAEKEAARDAATFFGNNEQWIGGNPSLVAKAFAAFRAATDRSWRIVDDEVSGNYRLDGATTGLPYGLFVTKKGAEIGKQQLLEAVIDFKPGGLSSIPRSGGKSSGARARPRPR